jgi:hypothetical protein
MNCADQLRSEYTELHMRAPLLCYLLDALFILAILRQFIAAMFVVVHLTAPPTHT